MRWYMYCTLTYKLSYVSYYRRLIARCVCGNIQLSEVLFIWHFAYPLVPEKPNKLRFSVVNCWVLYSK